MSRTNLSSQFNAQQRKDWRPKIVARNTFRYVVDGCIVTRLHETDIVRELENGRYKLNSGGWRTPTTKDRMNGALRGYNIYQKSGSWYVVKGGYGRLGGIPYFDGMIVPDAFNNPSAKGMAVQKKEQALRAAIRKFVAKIDKLKELPTPSNGDCWICCMHDTSGKSWGELSGDREHIVSHIKEGYLHGSLILNALKWVGYLNPGFIWQMDNARMGRGEKPSMVKRALKRYLYRQCGLVS